MKRGRPELPLEDKRTQFMGVRYTSSELIRLYALARLFRMDVAEYIRAMTLGNFGITKNTELTK